MKHVTPISRTMEAPEKAQDLNQILQFLFDIIDLINLSLDLLTNLREFVMDKDMDMGDMSS